MPVKLTLNFRIVGGKLMARPSRNGNFSHLTICLYHIPVLCSLVQERPLSDYFLTISHGPSMPVKSYPTWPQLYLTSLAQNCGRNRDSQKGKRQAYIPCASSQGLPPLDGEGGVWPEGPTSDCYPLPAVPDLWCSVTTTPKGWRVSGTTESWDGALGGSLWWSSVGTRLGCTRGTLFSPSSLSLMKIPCKHPITLLVLSENTSKSSVYFFPPLTQPTPNFLISFTALNLII